MLPCEGERWKSLFLALQSYLGKFVRPVHYCGFSLPLWKISSSSTSAVASFIVLAGRTHYQKNVIWSNNNIWDLVWKPHYSRLSYSQGSYLAPKKMVIFCQKTWHKIKPAYELRDIVLPKAVRLFSFSWWLSSAATRRHHAQSLVARLIFLTVYRCEPCCYLELGSKHIAIKKYTSSNT